MEMTSLVFDVIFLLIGITMTCLGSVMPQRLFKVRALDRQVVTGQCMIFVHLIFSRFD